MVRKSATTMTMLLMLGTMIMTAGCDPMMAVNITTGLYRGVSDVKVAMAKPPAPVPGLDDYIKTRNNQSAESDRMAKHPWADGRVRESDKVLQKRFEEAVSAYNKKPTFEDRGPEQKAINEILVQFRASELELVDLVLKDLGDRYRTASDPEQAKALQALICYFEQDKHVLTHLHEVDYRFSKLSIAAARPAVFAKYQYQPPTFGPESPIASAAPQQ